MKKLDTEKANLYHMGVARCDHFHIWQTHTPNCSITSSSVPRTGKNISIDRSIEERVWSYLGGIARKHDMTALQVGGIEDHAHALVMAKPKVAPCMIPKWLKAESSKWIHVELPALRMF